MHSRHGACIFLLLCAPKRTPQGAATGPAEKYKIGNQMKWILTPSLHAQMHNAWNARRSSDSWHAVALAGIENKPELRGLDVAVFERAPEAAVRALIEHIDTRYGGPAAYLETACGFGRAEQARLRELLTAPLK